jgi:hypothetical protein
MGMISKSAKKDGTPIVHQCQKSEFRIVISLLVIGVLKFSFLSSSKSISITEYDTVAKQTR